MIPRPDGAVLWITGLPASGKSTLARVLLETFEAEGRVTLWLDSDDLRHFITPAATYSMEERDLFYRAVGHFAILSARGGALVVVSATAPRQHYRDRVRHQVARFVEIYLACDERQRRARDFKGLYAKQDDGVISLLPGAGTPYEVPRSPELALDSTHEDPEALARSVLGWLQVNLPI
jgi:adenylylsulfate kinase